MSRRDRSDERWRSARAERVRAAREEAHRSKSISDADLGRTLAAAHAADEAERAKAVRNLCPCRIGWDGFQQGMEAVEKARKDTDPAVRRHALHVFEDAYHLQRVQDRAAEEASATDGNEDLKRQRERERQVKREVGRAFGRRHPPR